MTNMAKRLTDTDKWEDPWFMELNPKFKFMWLYVMDKCDHAGIYKHSDKLARLFTGLDIEWDKFKTACNGRLIQVSGDAYFIPNFIKYQYGPLNANSSVHRGVIRILEYYDLIVEKPVETVDNLLITVRVIKGLPKGFETIKDKDKDIQSTNTPYKDKVIAIVSDLNAVLGKTYRTKGATAELIIDRLKDGFDVEDFKACHRNMQKAWGNCSKMSKYLRPATLYGKQKFENYVNYHHNENDELDEIRRKAGLI